MHHIPAKRAVAGLIAGLLALGAAAGGGLASHLRTASALPPPPPTPPFTQCPPVGYDTGCAVLIILGPGGSKTTLVDPLQGPYDGVEDTLIGVQNNSGGSVSSLTLTGTDPSNPIFGFDSDGLCSGVSSNGAPGFIDPPVGCQYGSTGYEGRATDTPVASSASTTFPAEDFSAISGDHQTGTVNFDNPSIADGGSAYFSLEGPTSAVAPCTATVPATVTLSPGVDTNPVSTNHTVMATVDNLCGSGVGGVTVYFTVTRVPPPGTSGNCVTDSTGVCSFTYTGPALPATDVITGCAGGAPNLPPCGVASKTWTLPVGTSSCVVDITGGGWMTADNGDKVTFGGTVHTDQAGAPSGQEQYTDKPANLDMHSISIVAVTCSANQELADIYGTATINGSGSHLFRIEVTDPDSSSGSDTYWIILDTGYDSGSHPINGHIEMHKT